MAEIVNLRQARKEKERADKERHASQNRTAHGRTKAEKQAAKGGREKAAAFLDSHRRDRNGGDGAA